MAINQILSIDIGGSGIKCCLLQKDGSVIKDFKKLNTPAQANPEAVLETMAQLMVDFEPFDAISVGFPGYVRDGIVFTAPNLDNESWKQYPLAEAMEKRFSRPCKVVNDADLQGLGIAKGEGLEMVMTLGTGFGTALVLNGKLLPHLELAHLPITKRKDYDAYIGEKALKEIGEIKWNLRMERVIEIFKTVVNFDYLYISGGNAKRLIFPLENNMSIVSNREGIKGGAKLWN